MLGKTVEPVLEPLGFNWKMDVGLLAGVGAKELVVSTLGVMYAGDEGAEADENSTALQSALKGDIPLAAAVAYMVSDQERDRQVALGYPMRPVHDARRLDLRLDCLSAVPPVKIPSLRSE